MHSVISYYKYNFANSTMLFSSESVLLLPVRRILSSSSSRQENTTLLCISASTSSSVLTYELTNTILPTRPRNVNGDTEQKMSSEVKFHQIFGNLKNTQYRVFSWREDQHNSQILQQAQIQSLYMSGTMYRWLTVFRKLDVVMSFASYLDQSSLKNWKL
jgi:hypothetical protein